MNSTPKNEIGAVESCRIIVLDQALTSRCGQPEAVEASSGFSHAPAPDFHVDLWRWWKANKALAYRRAHDKSAPARCRALARTYGFLTRVDIPTELRLALLTAATCDQVLPSVQEILVRYRPVIEAASAAARA